MASAGHTGAFVAAFVVVAFVAGAFAAVASVAAFVDASVPFEAALASS